eukprot:m.130364 g.130364  ORF g.130364 m.130364 type:complete len:66 (-) comp14602_c0_seq1:4582-4779(-)
MCARDFNHHNKICKGWPIFWKANLFELQFEMQLSQQEVDRNGIAKFPYPLVSWFAQGIHDVACTW